MPFFHKPLVAQADQATARLAEARDGGRPAPHLWKRCYPADYSPMRSSARTPSRIDFTQMARLNAAAVTKQSSIRDR